MRSFVHYSICLVAIHSRINSNVSIVASRLNLARVGALEKLGVGNQRLSKQERHFRLLLASPHNISQYFDNKNSNIRLLVHAHARTIQLREL